MLKDWCHNKTRTIFVSSNFCVWVLRMALIFENDAVFSSGSHAIYDQPFHQTSVKIEAIDSVFSPWLINIDCQSILSQSWQRSGFELRREMKRSRSFSPWFDLLHSCILRLSNISAVGNSDVCSINVISKSTLTYSAILKLFAFLSNFLPTRNLSHCCFCLHSTDLQQYNQKCFLSERRKWKAKHFFHTKKRTYNPQSTTKKQILLTVSNLSLNHMKFV